MPRRLRDRTVRLMKYLASFAKSDWQLGDYPIRLRENLSWSSAAVDSHLKPVRWSAQVIGWWTLSGHGDTSQAAHDQLARSFQAYRASGRPLPRPGTDAPIYFAATDRIAAVESLAPKFFQEILDLNYEECLITDDQRLPRKLNRQL